MGFSKYFQSEHVTGPDLDGRDMTVTVLSVRPGEVGKSRDVLPILYGKNVEVGDTRGVDPKTGALKGVALNRGNFRIIASSLGQEETDWPGGTVTFYPFPWEFDDGEIRDVIRVRKPGGKSRQAGAVAPKPPGNGGAPAAPTRTITSGPQDKLQDRADQLFPDDDGRPEAPLPDEAQ